jgi:AraC family transcriptional regulator, regulatory protein of adaptative response / methylated-DNA-[protein]-cysteine methyltransferase
MVMSSADETKWQAVLERDATRDRQFVYAVTSTRIYCRPSCPSRRPSRSRVTFYPSPEAAEAEGYRACLRCEPRSQERSATRQVDRAREYLDRHWDEPVTLEHLGRVAAMSPYHLQRTFKRIVGVTPRAYANARRLDRMKSHLKQGDTVTRATYEAGFGSGSRAYEHARAGLGMTPGAYRNGGRGVQIHYTIVETETGRLLAAATERGLCSVMLGDDGGALEAELRREYPSAVLERDDAALKRYMEELVERLAGRAKTQAPASCRWTWRAPVSSGRCGTLCAEYQRGRPGLTGRSPGSSAGLPRHGRWRARAPATVWRC